MWLFFLVNLSVFLKHGLFLYFYVTGSDESKDSYKNASTPLKIAKKSVHLSFYIWPSRKPGHPEVIN